MNCLGRAPSIDSAPGNLRGGSSLSLVVHAVLARLGHPSRPGPFFCQAACRCSSNGTLQYRTAFLDNNQSSRASRDKTSARARILGWAARWDGWTTKYDKPFFATSIKGVTNVPARRRSLAIRGSPIATPCLAAAAVSVNARVSKTSPRSASMCGAPTLSNQHCNPHGSARDGAMPHEQDRPAI